jgi:hypothetical protein
MLTIKNIRWVQRKESMIRFVKLHNPDTGLYCVEFQLGWRSWKLTGFWFGKRNDSPTENNGNGEHILQHKQIENE